MSIILQNNKITGNPTTDTHPTPKEGFWKNREVQVGGASAGAVTLTVIAGIAAALLFTPGAPLVVLGCIIAGSIIGIIALCHVISKLEAEDAIHGQVATTSQISQKTLNSSDTPNGNSPSSQRSSSSSDETSTPGSNTPTGIATPPPEPEIANDYIDSWLTPCKKISEDVFETAINDVASFPIATPNDALDHILTTLQKNAKIEIHGKNLIPNNHKLAKVIDLSNEYLKEPEIANIRKNKELKRKLLQDCLKENGINQDELFWIAKSCHQCMTHHSYRLWHEQKGNNSKIWLDWHSKQPKTSSFDAAPLKMLAPGTDGDKILIFSITRKYDQSLTMTSRTPYRIEEKDLKLGQTKSIESIPLICTANLNNVIVKREINKIIDPSVLRFLLVDITNYDEKIQQIRNALTSQRKENPLSINEQIPLIIDELHKMNDEELLELQVDLFPSTREERQKLINNLLQIMPHMSIKINFTRGTCKLMHPDALRGTLLILPNRVPGMIQALGEKNKKPEDMTNPELLEFQLDFYSFTNDEIIELTQFLTSSSSF